MPVDEFTNLLDQIRELTIQLAAIVSKSEFLARDIESLCEDRKHIESEIADIKQKLAALGADETTAAGIRKENRDRIAHLQQQVAILETKAEYAKNTCDGLVKTVAVIQEVNWKTVGFAAGVSFAISLMMPWGIKLVFG
jgi:chromosome segregation ATPase